ncbi:MAG: polysaccharide deacetylase family protein [Desulfomonile tiedjei]|uniref:Polysaccharide deacetylase family protein n=1 Tax=Desulfomonile tiedjei TaxID=2358 RepID=A0A9D6Z7V2_9BACT|nr:polysaccharide deacetylase family protein [Desulfomonile tiedjei]
MPKALVKRKAKPDRAIFVVSVDTELAWGSFDHGGLENYVGHYAQEREIIRKLLDLFGCYDISATWAVVGHLFLERCAREGPDSHNHVLQPEYSWYPQGWLSHDPFSNAESEPFFYAPDIVDAIVASRQTNEIASHTFTHAILGDPECAREVARSQLAECRVLAKQKGLDLFSVVFPRNSVGHLDVLCEEGFLCFRGVERNWYHGLGLSRRLNKLCHFIDRFLAICPPVYDEVDCYACESGSQWLVDLPASMFYVPFGGLWSLVNISARVRQARKGLSEAVRKKAVFHLWFHPVNLASSPLLLGGLEEIFFLVNDQIKQGNMTSMTMSQTASHITAGL